MVTGLPMSEPSAPFMRSPPSIDWVPAWKANEKRPLRPSARAPPGESKAARTVAVNQMRAFSFPPSAPCDPRAPLVD